MAAAVEHRQEGGVSSCRNLQAELSASVFLQQLQRHVHFWRDFLFKNNMHLVEGKKFNTTSPLVQQLGLRLGPGAPLVLLILSFCYSTEWQLPTVRPLRFSDIEREMPKLGTNLVAAASSSVLWEAGWAQICLQSRSFVTCATETKTLRIIISHSVGHREEFLWAPCHVSENVMPSYSRLHCVCEAFIWICYLYGF